MNRLVKKDKYGEFEPIKHNEVCEKLYKLECIETELGCPLEVVFKALKEKLIITKRVIWLENPKTTLETYKVEGLFFNGAGFELWLHANVFGDEFCVYTKDYGETWWLKGDRSE